MLTKVITDRNFTLEIGEKSLSLDSPWNNFTCNPCSPGHYCQMLSVNPESALEDDIIPSPCPSGTYSPVSGRVSCIPCNIGQGEYCPEGAVMPSDTFSQSHCIGNSGVNFSKKLTTEINSEVKCRTSCQKNKGNYVLCRSKFSF